MPDPKSLILSKQALAWCKENGRTKEVEVALGLRQAYRSSHRPNTYVGYTDEQLASVARVHQDRLNKVKAEIDRRAVATN